MTDPADLGITALSRHYGRPEAEIRADIADYVLDESGVRQHIPAESLILSLAAALGALNDCGCDDATVTAAENPPPDTRSGGRAQLHACN
jgi:hypothetical protein